MKKILLFCALATIVGGTYALTSTESQSRRVLSKETAESTEETPAYGVSIDTIDAQLYSESGLDLNYFSDVKYVCQTPDGSYLGFYQATYTDAEGNVEDCVALGSLSVASENITLPDAIKVGDVSYSVLGIYDNYNLYDGIYYGNVQVKTLTLPECFVSFYGDEYGSFNELNGIYMLGSVPYSNYYIYCPVYVCNKDYWAGYVDSGIYKNLSPYGWDFDWITVNVEKTGEFAETYLTQNGYSWANAINVKVTGNINEIDMNAMKNMTGVRKLDLTETNLTAVPASFMQNHAAIEEVLLPETVNSIGNYAFQNCDKLVSFDLGGATDVPRYCFEGCSNLQSIDLSGVESVQYYAFQNCSKLSNIDFSNIKKIGYYAFGKCTSLKEVNATSALTIGGYAFVNTNITKADVSAATNFIDNNYNGYYGDDGSSVFSGCKLLEEVVLAEGLKTLPYRMFYGCSSLVNVNIPSTITTIEDNVFYNCSSLANIELPSKLASIGDYAFYDCSALTEITLPATLETIGSNAFSNTSLVMVKCHAAAPPIATASFVSGVDMTKAYLYVPAFSKDYYRNTLYWADFYLMKSLDEQVDYIFVDRPLSINLMEEDNDIVANNPTIEMTYYDKNYHAQLTAEGAGTLSAGQMIINTTMYSNPDNSYAFRYMPTLINYADKMRADNVIHNVKFNNENSWYFISLPYDVIVSDIVSGEDTYWVIRRYDGAARATGTAAWTDMTADDTMEAGKGYIISVSAPSYYNEYGSRVDPIAQLTFTSGNSLTKNNLFRPTDVIVPLEEYVAEFAHNRSWNLVGNPYPCYFDMHYLADDFTAPITVWNGSSYEAFSPVDDDYVMSPYQAFFVQRPLDRDNITFMESGRMHTNTIPTATEAPAMISVDGRNVFNFVVAADSVSNKARIVLNPEASFDYELDRDASKFFSDSDVEIYVNGKDGLYAIDERPVGDGEAVLGVRAAKEGMYTISLNGKFSSEWTVTLIDNVAGTEIDLTKEDYSFSVEEGEDATRFKVLFSHNNSESGINDVISTLGADAEVVVTTVAGVKVYEGKLGEIEVSEAGIYVITCEGKGYKVVLK